MTAARSLYSIDAEMSVLGSMILGADKGVAEDMASVLTPEDFYRSAHQEMFVTLRILVGKRDPIDLVTLKNALVRRGLLDMVGGEDYMIQIAEFVPSAANARHYAQIVRDMAILRRVDRAGREAISLVQDEHDASADVILNRAEQLFMAIRDTSAGAADLLDWGEIDIAAPQRGVTTGFAALDKATGVGWVCSQNNVVSAYTKGGKTSMMVGATRAAVLAGKLTVYATFADLDSPQLKRRALKADCGVGGPAADIVRDTIFRETLESHNDPFGEWRPRLKVYSARLHGRTVEQFVSRMAAARRKFAYDVVFVDYAQKLTSSAFKPGEKTAMLEYASDYIEEHLARRYDIPVVIGSQLTKGLDGQWVTKYARALEEDAGFVVRTSVDDDTGTGEIQVPLNRFGPKGLVFDADWNPERVQFQNVRPRV